MKLITLDEWDAASEDEKDRLLAAGAILSTEDTVMLGKRLGQRVYPESPEHPTGDA